MHLSVHRSIYVSIHLCIHLSIYQSICQSIYLSIYLSIRQSTYLSMHLSVYIYIYFTDYLVIYVFIYSIFPIYGHQAVHEFQDLPSLGFCGVNLWLLRILELLCGIICAAASNIDWLHAASKGPTCPKMKKDTLSVVRSWKSQVAWALPHSYLRYIFGDPGCVLACLFRSSGADLGG